MKYNRILITLTLTVVLFAAACTSKNDEDNKAADNDNDQTEQQADQMDETENNEFAETEEPDAEENSDQESAETDDNNAADTDQKSLIQNMAAQEVTNFSFNLPESIPVTEGKYLTATTDNEEDKFEITFYESDEKIPVNDDEINKSAQKIAHLKITQFDSQEQADEKVAFEDYKESGGQEVDLGHDITGYQDAGAGSVFTSWNEGRWALSARSATENSDNGVTLAKNTVNFLENHALPAPKQHGTIKLDAENNDSTVLWEENTTVYQIDEVRSPLDTVKIAASFK